MTLNCGKVSLIAGTSGSNGNRFSDVTPSTLILPAAASGSTAVGAPNSSGICPPRRSFTEAAILLQHLAGKAVRRGTARRPKAQILRLLLAQRDELGHRVRRHIVGRGKQQRRP